MGYNTSIKTVARHEPQLRQLVEAASNGQTLRFETTQPRKLAYKLREALHAAREHDTYRHYYQEVWPYFEFKEEPGAVVARFTGLIEDVTLVQGEPLKVSSQPMLKPHKKTLSDALSLTDVVAAALRFGSDKELHFPNAQLDASEKTLLKKWTTKGPGSDWTFIDHFDSGLTLTKYDVVEDR